MPFRLLMIGLFGCWAAFSAGCAPGGSPVEVEGQIFLTAPEGDSIALSLVPVQIFDRAVIARFVEERERRLEVTLEELDAEVEAREEALAAAREERAEAAERLRLRRAALETDREAFLAEVAGEIDEYRNRIRMNEAFIIDLDQTPQPPEGIPGRGEFEAYRARVERWYSMDRTEREAWQEVLQGQNADLEQAIEEARERRAQRLAAWEREQANLESELETYEAAVSAAERDLAESRERRDGFPSAREYFDGLPEPVYQVRTDANGEFLLVLEAGRQVALVARVDREIRGSREQHAWLLWLDPRRPEQRKILLSNHNSMSRRELAGNPNSGGNGKGR